MTYVYCTWIDFLYNFSIEISHPLDFDMGQVSVKIWLFPSIIIGGNHVPTGS